MKAMVEKDNGNNMRPLVSIITVVLNRPDELQRTIKSVSSQTYNNIEYLIIDGGSDKKTISVIKSNSSHISYSVSEEDEGIYDAINKGIMASNGEYIAILHAGDIFDRDFIERSVAELRKSGVDPLRTVTYANHRHGDKEVEAGPVSNGLYLHHLGINHQTFLVPKALYDAIGFYNPNLKITSDVIWMSHAVDFGCDFRKIDGYPLYFDPGGASSAQSEKQHNLVVGEAIKSYRIHFSFLPIPVAEAIYLYRFTEDTLRSINGFLAECEHMAEPPENWTLFIDALKKMMLHIWSLRPLNISHSKADEFQASIRFDVAESLGLPLQSVNMQPLVSIITVVLNRPDELQRTIKSVSSQTYNNIEYLIIDGGSDKKTISVIKSNSSHISYSVSEEDEGIYDAINKGIMASNGEYIAILHAGDIFDRDFIERSVAELRKSGVDPLRTVTYANHRHGDKEVEAGPVSNGLYLHHLGINHQTFLVPKALYDAVGFYNPNLKIVSDAVWMSHAVDFGCDFRKIDGYPLYFNPGGASSAQSEKQRNLVIGEWIKFYRIHFSFLPIPVAREIYLYRFKKEDALRSINGFLAECEHMAEPPENWTLFIDALKKMMLHIWSLRPLNISHSKTDQLQASIRFDVAESLGLPLQSVNMFLDGQQPVSEVVTEMEAIAERSGDRRVTLHFLEVFSRPSETFVPDLVNAMQSASDDVHVILCETRLLAAERPYPNIMVFPFTRYPSRTAKRLLELLLDRLDPKQFVFHFAINGWRLLERVEQKYRKIPALYMTHGIDVTDLEDEGGYRSFIVDGVSRLPNVRFTTVSEYLQGKLLTVGVPEHKISVVGNSVHGRFWENRTPGREKTEARRKSPYDLRLLNIGRLVPLKGHAYLIRAVRILRDDYACNAHLTIVWGSDGPLLAKTRRLIQSAGLRDQITLVERVNFDEEPTYFDGFDMFVSSSVETGGRKSRSETFGIAILEAITAGLPVIVTDAGGQPEVVGDETRYASIAKAASAESLAKAISDMFQSGVLDGDNADYALERLSRFSRDRQVEGLKNAIGKVETPRLTAALFSTRINQGAGNAAYKMHKSLLGAGVASQLNCLERTWDFQCPVGVSTTKFDGYVREGSHQLNRRELYNNHTIFSLNPEGIGQDDLDRICADADVINLHWYARFLSNENIAYLSNMGKPLIVTVRDMHPFTGGCHFSQGCEEWRRCCSVCAQLPGYAARLPHKTLRWKLDNWNLDNITIVALSEFSKEMIQESRLFGDCRIEVIPNPAETEIFQPMPTDEARKEFGLKPDAKVIAFLPSSNSIIKGTAEAMDALAKLPRTIDGKPVQVLTAGADIKLEGLPMKVVRAGYISERQKLSRFYSAADITLVPSTAETFSNTAQESLACGTPVAGFRTGAIPEMAQGVRGDFAEPGDVIRLAEIMRGLLAVDKKPRGECRRFVLETFDPNLIARKYTDLFQDLCHNPVQAQTTLVEDDSLRELQRRYVVDRFAGNRRRLITSLLKIFINRFAGDPPISPRLRLIRKSIWWRLGRRFVFPMLNVFKGRR